MGKDYSPKPINELMEHLRVNQGIEVKSDQTRQMLNYGYYHAYKGYRFFKSGESIIPYTSFEQIIAVIDYDNALKAAFYPQIMFLETAIKNIVVASLIEGVPSAAYDQVLKYKMNDDGANEMLKKRRMRLKEKLRSTILKRHRQNNQIVAHFNSRGDIIPIWALFEIISLGDFAMFTYCLNRHVRVGLLRELNMLMHDDREDQLLSNILYTLKDLRNALAHNNIIFDTRFKEQEPNGIVAEWLQRELRLDTPTDFSSVLDYYLIIGVLLKKIEYGDEKLQAFVTLAENIIKTLKEKVPTKIYCKLATAECDKKLSALREYIAD